MDTKKSARPFRDRLLVGLTSAAMVATLVPAPALAESVSEIAPVEETVGEAASDDAVALGDAAEALKADGQDAAVAEAESLEGMVGEDESQEGMADETVSQEQRDEANPEPKAEPQPMGAAMGDNEVENVRVVKTGSELKTAIELGRCYKPTNIRLDKDVEIDSIVVDDDKEIFLDMAGHTITLTHAENGCAFRNYGELNIKGGGTITSKSPRKKKPAWEGGAIVNDEYGRLVIEDCTIKENYSSGYAAGVNNSGTATLNRVHILRNRTEGADEDVSSHPNSWGGGVFNAYGRLTMNDCVVEGNNIFGNSTENDGAGICNLGTLEMHGGRVFENIAFGHKDHEAYGGGIYNRGTATLDGVTIDSWNSADFGGGLCTAGKTTLRGCTIEENGAYHLGGGIAVLGDGDLIFCGDTTVVEGNGALEGASGIYHNGRSISLEGAPVIKNNRKPDKKGKDKVLSPDSKKVESFGIWLAKDKRVNFAGPLTEGASVGIELETRTGSFANGYGLYNHNDSPNRYFITGEGLAAYLAEHEEAAIREAKTAEFHTVTFHKNAPDGSDETCAQDVESDYPTGLRKNDFKCEYYDFVGWNTKADGSGDAYADKADVTTGADMDLYAQWQRKELALCSYSISLTDSFDIRYNVKELEDDPQNYKIAWSYKGEEHEKVGLENTDDNWVTVAECAAKEMVDEVKVTVSHRGEDGEWTELKSDTISIRGYCEAVIAKGGKVSESINDKQAEQLCNLCKATLDYGAYAQSIKGYKTDDLATAGNGGKNYFSEICGEDLSCDAYVKNALNEWPKGLDCTDIRLSMITTSKLQLVISVKHDKDAKLGDYTFEVLANGDRWLDASDYTVTDEGGCFKVCIKDIPVTNIHKEYYIDISDSRYVGLYYHVAPKDYIARAQAEGNDDLAMAIYNYCYHAQKLSELF